MSVYDDRRDALEEHEFRMGLERGRLAVTLDLLTDALVLVGQHGVYCQSARQAGNRRGEAWVLNQLGFALARLREVTREPERDATSPGRTTP